MRMFWVGQTERGQAMVEFAFLLLVLLTLAAGMLYQSRLLSIQTWAQQEARYIAFEQTWAPNSARPNPLQAPKTKLQDGDYFRRPGIISGLDVQRNATSSGSVGDLSFRFDDSPSPVSSSVEARMMFASRRNSIWNARSEEWIDRFSEFFGGIATAFAAQDQPRWNTPHNLLTPRPRRNDQLKDPENLPRNPLERAMVKHLEQVELGEKVCEAFEAVLSRYAAYDRFPQFAESSCSARINRDFGVHLARNMDFREIFREYGYELEWGGSADTALSVTAEREISRQFYSFFDTLVKTASSDIVVGAFEGARGVQIGSAMIDSSITRMVSDLRYVGSSAAIVTLTAQYPVILSTNPMGHNQAGEKSREDSVREILNVDAANFLPVIGNGFLLNPTYFPVPPTFAGMGPTLFDGVMKNVLWLDTGLFEPLIEQQNKNATVVYKPEKGLFPAAMRRFAWKNTDMRSNFFLITEPWHIPRRETPTGPYRQLGDQYDLKDKPTDEGILRRRVSGLYMFPKRPGAFLSPLKELPGMDFLGPVVDVIESLDEVFSFLGGIIDNNVFLDFMHGLRDIPGIGGFLPIPPVWPAVRPQAYPRSVEMREDKMVRGEERDFSDYVEEQRNHNPPPEPDFGDPG